MGEKHTKQNNWKNWPYKNTTLLLLGVLCFFAIAQTTHFAELMGHVGKMGYAGAFLTGIFFVSTFTVAPAGYVLYKLAEVLHPVEIALLAGIGAMVGDYVLFRFIKDGLFEELAPLARKLQHPGVKKLFATPYFAWLLPVVGAAIIASPLPDEAGISLLGLSKVKKWQFFIVTYVLNALGIFTIVSVARV